MTLRGRIRRWLFISGFYVKSQEKHEAQGIITVFNHFAVPVMWWMQMHFGNDFGKRWWCQGSRVLFQKGCCNPDFCPMSINRSSSSPEDLELLSLRCVSLGLEFNSAGHRSFRSTKRQTVLFCLKLIQCRTKKGRKVQPYFNTSEATRIAIFCQGYVVFLNDPGDVCFHTVNCGILGCGALQSAPWTYHMLEMKKVVSYENNFTFKPVKLTQKFTQNDSSVAIFQTRVS